MGELPDAAADETADVAVVGAGPAGLAAAIAATAAGAKVLLLDEGFGPGGQIWRHRDHAELGEEARRHLTRWHHSGAKLLSGVGVFDVTGDLDAGFDVWATRGDESLRIRAGSVVLATGARERFLPFPGWTLPNVLGAGAMQALVKGGLTVQGRRIVVAGSGPLLLAVGALLAERGARVIEVAEQASAASLAAFTLSLASTPGRLLQALAYRGRLRRNAYHTGAWVRSAQGGDRVEQVTLTNGRKSWSHACDWLCVGYGLLPNMELAAVAGCALEESDAVRVDPHQETSLPGIFCAGEPTGIGGVELALAEGEVAGRAAAGRRDHPVMLLRRRDRLRQLARRMQSAFALREELRGLAEPDTIVCRCEDVPFGRLDRQWTARQAKLYTRLGMGPCQGRVCGPAMSFLYGWTRDSMRPPTVPVPLQALTRMAASHDHPRGTR